MDQNDLQTNFALAKQGHPSPRAKLRHSMQASGLSDRQISVVFSLEPATAAAIALSDGDLAVCRQFNLSAAQFMAQRAKDLAYYLPRNFAEDGADVAGEAPLDPWQNVEGVTDADMIVLRSLSPDQAKVVLKLLSGGTEGP